MKCNNVLYNDLVTGNYQTLLEEVPTFFNNFIPRGLFFDLTDANTTEEQGFDRINGFTMNDIYSLFDSDIRTIQEFRDVWETAYPNVNNADLFDEYDVN